MPNLGEKGRKLGKLWELKQKPQLLNEILGQLKERCGELPNQAQNVRDRFDKFIQDQSYGKDVENIYEELSEQLDKLINQTLNPLRHLIQHLGQLTKFPGIEESYPVPFHVQRLKENWGSLKSENYLQNASMLYFTFCHSDSPDWGLVGIELAIALERELQVVLEPFNLRAKYGHPPSLSEIKKEIQKSEIENTLKGTLDESLYKEFLEQLGNFAGDSKRKATIYNLRNRCAHSPERRPERSDIDEVMCPKLLYPNAFIEAIAKKGQKSR